MRSDYWTIAWVFSAVVFLIVQWRRPDVVVRFTPARVAGAAALATTAAVTVLFATGKGLPPTMGPLDFFGTFFLYFMWMHGIYLCWCD